jgi:TPP-dependent indolepyruvate ferredoxin oxidoreductase alpha subunit
MSLVMEAVFGGFGRWVLGAQKEQDRERRAEEEMRRIMDSIDEDERQRKEEEAYQRQIAREKIAEAEALEAMEERGRAMARAFEDEMNRVVEDISGKIQGSMTGITQAGGDMSGVIEVLNRIDRKTERR